MRAFFFIVLAFVLGASALTEDPDNDRYTKHRCVARGWVAPTVNDSANYYELLKSTETGCKNIADTTQEIYDAQTSRKRWPEFSVLRNDCAVFQGEFERCKITAVSCEAFAKKICNLKFVDGDVIKNSYCTKPLPGGGPGAKKPATGTG